MIACARTSNIVLRLSRDISYVSENLRDHYVVLCLQRIVYGRGIRCSFKTH